MRGRPAALALVTDAFGGRGGIAQYNRDLIGAWAASPRLANLDVLPRRAEDPTGALPAKVGQRAAHAGRLAYSAAAWRATRSGKPEVLFCGHLYMAPLAAALARRAGAKLVIQLHGIEMWRRPTTAQRRALSEADLVLAVSRDTRARALGFADMPPERVRILPNTVGPAFTPGDGSAMRARLGLGEAFVLLSVGRLDGRERYKGHDRIIPLLARLAEAGRDVVYLIAGDGDDRPRLDALAAAHGVSSQVRFLGQAPGADLPDLFRAADLFVLPSTGEGFGIVFLEAMACGTPALGLASAGAVDALIAGGPGAAVGEADLYDALAAAISRPRADGAALAAEVHRRFAPALFARRAQRILSDLLGEAACIPGGERDTGAPVLSDPPPA
jgi:phosphatidylinositol alpha-1,6-mannosyltransferase